MEAPGVEQLLDVDREYREKADAGSLPRIAPLKFNREHKAWLPVLHTRFGPWHFNALFSNTERAHELRCTHDWVVVYWSDGEGGEGQATVVTEWRGSLKGRRVVRGREAECARYYRCAERTSTLEPSRSESGGYTTTGSPA
jgi:hypothetical protein